MLMQVPIDLVNSKALEYLVYAFIGFFLLVKGIGQVSPLLNGKNGKRGKACSVSELSFQLQGVSDALKELQQDVAVLRAENHDLHVWHDIDKPDHPGQKVWYENSTEISKTIQEVMIVQRDLLTETKILAETMRLWLAQGCPNSSKANDLLVQVQRKVDQINTSKG